MDDLNHPSSRPFPSGSAQNGARSIWSGPCETLDAAGWNNHSLANNEDSTFGANPLDDVNFLASGSASEGWLDGASANVPGTPGLWSLELGHLDDPSPALVSSNDLDLRPDLQATGAASNQPTFSNVTQWLDGSYRPEQPCSHCRRHRLQCLIIRTAPANPNPEAACSSCVALFRVCSLARGEKRQPSRFETLSPVMGHLHGLPEFAEAEVCDVCAWRGLTLTTTGEWTRGFGAFANVSGGRQGIETVRKTRGPDIEGMVQ